MSVTDDLNELIALHGNCRDALNVTLAKLRMAQDTIAVLEEAAQPLRAVNFACTCAEGAWLPIGGNCCERCGGLVPQSH